MIYPRYSLSLLLCLLLVAAILSAVAFRYDWLGLRREQQTNVFDQLGDLSTQLERRMQMAANEYARESSGKPSPDEPPRVDRHEQALELADLDVVLREVVFTPPINGVAAALFSETEVTNAAYARYLAATATVRDDRVIEELVNLQQSSFIFLSTGAPSIQIADPLSLWRHGEYPERSAEHPVSFVTVHQAMAFCDWLDARYELNGDFRLPTEDEWLWAAYGERRNYPWGDEQRDWTADDTEPVKSRPHLRTPDGLFGMWGNVSELVLSPWNGYGGKVASSLVKITGATPIPHRAAATRGDFELFSCPRNNVAIGPMRAIHFKSVATTR